MDLISCVITLFIPFSSSTLLCRLDRQNHSDSIPLPAFLRLLFFRPKAGADAQYHQQEHHEQRRCPCPARCGPRVGVVDEYSYERLEEACLERVRETRPVPQVLPVQEKSLRAPRRGVSLVEALAPRADQSSFLVLVVEDALPSSGAVDGAEHVGADAAETRAGDSGPKRTRKGAHLNCLEVLLARVPPSVYLELQIEVVIDALSLVTPPLTRGGLKAHAVLAVLLAVDDVNSVIVGLDPAVQVGRLKAGVHRTVDGAVVRLTRAANGRVREVLELDWGLVVTPQAVVDDSARHLVGVGWAAAPAGSLIAEVPLGVGGDAAVP
mmetsp:Transcript_11597/g.25111  ORF Transcript_11597/g.25111 Transcript_11597/m.25111 type:complete len:323 (+) Transcript_11597:44-1012(+)